MSLFKREFFLLKRADATLAPHHSLPFFFFYSQGGATLTANRGVDFIAACQVRRPFWQTEPKRPQDFRREVTRRASSL
jgi:hypothetical protein